MSDTTRPVANNATKPDLSFLGPPDQPGRLGTLGTYQVVKLLGYGGMGVVLHAHDPRLQRDVALKVMNAKVAADPTSRQRFLREARATAAVTHDHIVTIYEVGEANGVPFIAMERLLGLNVERYLKQLAKPMSNGQIQRIARETAAGLQAAHDKGLVHRDIKLSNIFLEKDGGRVKLVDFGLAILPDGDHRVSSTGLIVGTPEFMSPEQARGEVVDHRSDLFSLGVVLYRLTTGVQPFRGPTAIAVIMAISADTPPPPVALNPDTPRPLSDLIVRLLAKHPKDRPQQAREVIAALAGTTSSHALPAVGVAASPPPLPVPDLWNFTPAVLPDGASDPAPPAYPPTFPTTYPSASTNAYPMPTVPMPVPPPPPVAMAMPVPPPPPSRRADFDDLDERPSRRSTTRPSRREDDDEGDAPTRTATPPGSAGAAKASLVLGITACVLAFIPCCGLQYLSPVLSVTGLICAFVGRRESSQRKAGFILNGVALGLAVVAITSMAMLLTSLGLRANGVANTLNEVNKQGGFNAGGGGGNGGGQPATENGTVELSFANFDEIKADPLELFFDGELDPRFRQDHFRWYEDQKYTRAFPAGDHTFELKISGQSVHVGKITVKPASQGVTFVTVPQFERPNATGTLEVTFTGASLFVGTNGQDQNWDTNVETWVDGKLANWKLWCLDNTYNIRLTAGKHVIRLTKNGVDVYEKEVEVKKAKDGKTFLSVDRNELFQQTVTITNSNPLQVGQQAYVYVNDRSFGEYPVGARTFNTNVPVGRNKIEVIQKKPKEVSFAKWTVDVTKAKPVLLDIK